MSFQKLTSKAIPLFMMLFVCAIISNSYSQNATPIKMELKYLVREPKIKSEHPPLLLLLHGFGSNEKDLFSFANQLPDKYLVVAAQGQISIGGDGYAWYHVDFSSGKPAYKFEEEEKSRKVIIDFIEAIKKQYQVDAKQVYLCGFSQGAIMSYSIALTRPDLVKGIAVMSGRLLEEIKPLIQPKEKLSGLKLFVSHGTNDNVLTFDYAKQSVAYLNTLGLQPIFKQYTAGHEINAAMFSDLLEFLK